MRSLTRIRLIPPAPAYEPATTHWPPGSTTRSSGAAWPQMNCTSPLSAQGGGVGGVGDCCAEIPMTAAIPSINATRVSLIKVLRDGPTVQLGAVNAKRAAESRSGLFAPSEWDV